VLQGAFTAVESASRQLAKRIRLLRAKQGLTQEELAAKCGISIKHLQKLESGKEDHEPRIGTLEKLSQGFGIPIWKLVKFDGKVE